jgi:virulence-associated protein VapD
MAETKEEQLDHCVTDWVESDRVFNGIYNFASTTIAVRSNLVTIKNDCNWHSSIIFDFKDCSNIMIIKSKPNKITGIVWYEIESENITPLHYNILNLFKKLSFQVRDTTNPEVIDYLQPSHIKAMSPELSSIKNYIKHENIEIECEIGIWFFTKDLDLLKDKKVTVIYRCRYDYVDLNRLLHKLLDNNNQITLYVNCEIPVCSGIYSQINCIKKHYHESYNEESVVRAV